ncbi:MAG: glycoside hydrolase family 25 [Oscillospiraceae bacterium]|nr:glycoside hydrolase family 25 [Oscillospiraceae bacterium]
MKWIRAAALLMSILVLSSCGKTEESSLVMQGEESLTVTTSATIPEDSQVQTTEGTTGSQSGAVTTTTTTGSTTEETTTTPPILTQKPKDAILAAQDSVEVYTALTLAELIGDTNVQLLNGSSKVVTDQTGTFEIAVEYCFEGAQYAHALSYTVVDTTAPLLLNAGWTVYLKQGAAFHLEEHVGYADQYDRKPVLTYTGMVNTGVCGTYPITASVTDASGNATVWDLTIKVVEKLPSGGGGNSSSLSFDTLIQNYAAENVCFGIDVSKWQSEIDFEAVKRAGCSFVIMRIGYFYDDIAMDEYYLRNMEKARAAGLKVGVYLYTRANTEAEVRENVRWIAKQLNGQQLDFPVVFDWESFSQFQQYEMSVHDLNALFVLFAKELEAHGYSAMLYSSKFPLETFWYPQTEYPVWLAHYTDQTDYQGDYVMWQMSCTGRIPGISGAVDLNILYTDRAERFWKP